MSPFLGLGLEQEAQDRRSQYAELRDELGELVGVLEALLRMRRGSALEHPANVLSPHSRSELIEELHAKRLFRVHLWAPS